MSNRKPAPLATVPRDVLPATIYLVMNGAEDRTIESAYFSRESAERRITEGLRGDYVKYLERWIDDIPSLHPDTNPTPQSFVDFASRHSDLDIEEVEVLG